MCREFIHVGITAARAPDDRDPATLRRTDHAGFRTGVRRGSCVVEREAVSTLAHQFIACVTGSTQVACSACVSPRVSRGGTVKVRGSTPVHVRPDHVFHGHQYAARLPVRGYAPRFLDSVQDFAQLVSIQSFIFCNKLLDGSGFDCVT